MNSHEWLLPPGIQEETEWFDPPRTFADQMVDILDDAHRQIAASVAIPAANIAPPSDRVVFGRGDLTYVLHRRIWEALSDSGRREIRQLYGPPHG